MQFTVYEMKMDKVKFEDNIGIQCIPFEKHFFEEYKKIYNECFFDMRKSLDIQPYDFLLDYAQIQDKTESIFLLVEGNDLVGSVACYDNEIDDLIVNKKYQGQGIGKQLLLWAMKHIAKNDSPISLRVAEWNERAVRLYKRVGFTITKTESVIR